MNFMARLFKSKGVIAIIALVAVALGLVALAEHRSSSAAPSSPSGVTVLHNEAGMALALSDEARAMAAVETAPVERRKLNVEIRAFGKVQYNETGLATITSRVEGYVEKLFVDYTGVQVEKGDHLLELYSPDLVVAQRELLLALKNPNADLVESAKLKLRRWEIGEEQIDEIIKSRQPQERMTIRSPIRGTVYEKMIVERSAVHPGDVLYHIANLDSIWVNLDIYEYELSWIKIGQRVEIKAEAVPGQVFEGMVTFIQPFLNEDTRTVRVRVNVANREHVLKPGLFVSAVVSVPVLRGGKPGPTGREGKYSCPMHPEILNDASGNCPICGMALKQLPGQAVAVSDEDWKVLAVPATAVLDSGLRKVVYVERTRGEFASAPIETGQKAGDYFPILAGVKEGDRVAVRGNFLLDSQFQISGLPSLFSATGGASMAGMHQHGGGAKSSDSAPQPAQSSGHEGHAH